jgi:hypothetical protein
VRVHFDKSKSTVRLEARLGDISKVLEEWDQVRLGSIWGQIADVAGRLPLGSLGDDHIVALNTVRGEVVVAERSSGCHAHGSHGLLLGDGGLALLVSPVATNGAGTQPFAVHGAECALGISAIPESNKSISTRPACFHVPHDASLGDGAKSRECLEKHLVVDLVGQVTDEDMEVVGSILLCGVVRLISPIDANFLGKSKSIHTTMGVFALTLL